MEVEDRSNEKLSEVHAARGPRALGGMGVQLHQNRLQRTDP